MDICRKEGRIRDALEDISGKIMKNSEKKALISPESLLNVLYETCKNWMIKGDMQYAMF